MFWTENLVPEVQFSSKLKSVSGLISNGSIRRKCQWDLAQSFLQSKKQQCRNLCGAAAEHFLSCSPSHHMQFKFLLLNDVKRPKLHTKCWVYVILRLVEGKKKAKRKSMRKIYFVVTELKHRSRTMFQIKNIFILYVKICIHTHTECVWCQVW